MKQYAVALHPLALKEMEEAYDWYEAQSTGLGNRFVNSLQKQIALIAAYPERYAKKVKNLRETRLPIFPYIIVYEFLKKEKIVFISYIFHTSRNPRLKYKRKRL